MGKELDLISDPLVDGLKGLSIHWVDGPPNIDSKSGEEIGEEIGETPKIRIAIIPPTSASVRGSVIIAPGRSEFIEKHADTARAMLERGFAVMIIDQRGQGMSSRLTDNPQAGHMDDFARAAGHVALAIKAHEADLPTPRLLLSHSMGGAIALELLAQTAATGDNLGIKAAAFSSPMWGLKAFKGANLLASLLVKMGQGKTFAPTVAQKWSPERFGTNVLTHNSANLARWNSLFLAEERVQIAGPTNGWVKAAYDLFNGFTPDRLGAINTPILVVSAGDDRLIDNASHDRNFGLLPHAIHHILPLSYHEILHETDEFKGQFFAWFDEWLANIADFTAPMAAVAEAKTLAAKPAAKKPAAKTVAKKPAAKTVAKKPAAKPAAKAAPKKPKA